MNRVTWYMIIATAIYPPIFAGELQSCYKDSFVTNIFELRGVVTTSAVADYLFRYVDSHLQWNYFRGFSNAVQWVGTRSGYMDGIYERNGTYFIAVPKPFDASKLYSKEIMSSPQIEDFKTTGHIPLFSHIHHDENVTEVCFKRQNREKIANGILLARMLDFKRGGAKTEELQDQYFRRQGLFPENELRRKRSTTKTFGKTEIFPFMLAHLLADGALWTASHQYCHGQAEIVNHQPETCDQWKGTSICIKRVMEWCTNKFPGDKVYRRIVCSPTFGSTKTICTSTEDFNIMKEPDVQDPHSLCFAAEVFGESYLAKCSDVSLESRIVNALKGNLESVDLPGNVTYSLLSERVLAIENKLASKELDKLIDGVNDLFGAKKEITTNISLLFDAVNRGYATDETLNTMLNDLDIRVRALEVAKVEMSFNLESNTRALQQITGEVTYVRNISDATSTNTHLLEQATYKNIGLINHTLDDQANKTNEMVKEIEDKIETVENRFEPLRTEFKFELSEMNLIFLELMASMKVNASREIASTNAQLSTQLDDINKGIGPLTAKEVAIIGASLTAFVMVLYGVILIIIMIKVCKM